MFGSTVGFSGSADRMALFWFCQIRDGDISAADRPIYSVFGSRMGFLVGGSNGANSGLTKFNRYVGENNARGVIRLVTI